MIILETLFDHLTYHGISKKEAAKLFGKSEKTLYRWNENPPDWVLRIVQLLGQKPSFPDLWNGWYFDSEFICDPAGNKYHINEVSTIFWTRQLIESLTGSTFEIYSLKGHLEKKLKKQPVLKISLVESSTNDELKQWSIAL